MWSFCDVVVVGRSSKLTEERLPKCFGLLLLKSLKQHRNCERVVWPESDLLAPMRIVQPVAIEILDTDKIETLNIHRVNV